MSYARQYLGSVGPSADFKSQFTEVKPSSSRLSSSWAQVPSASNSLDLSSQPKKRLELNRSFVVSEEVAKDDAAKDEATKKWLWIGGGVAVLGLVAFVAMKK